MGVKFTMDHPFIRWLGWLLGIDLEMTPRHLKILLRLGVLGKFWGSKYLLRRSLDVWGTCDFSLKKNGIP